MVRAALFRSILEALSSHRYLLVEDFSVAEYALRSGDPGISVRYRYDNRFFFNFAIPKAKHADERRYMFGCTMNPGRESAEESLTVAERDGLLNELREWLGRLHEDLVAVPVVRQFEAHAIAIEQLRERLGRLPDEPLTREDIDQFREALEKVKLELTQQLKQEVADKEQLRQKLDEVTHDIEFLRSTLETLTKRQWGEVLAVRLRKWRDKFGLRQLAAGARVLKGVLPGSLSDELDVVAEQLMAWLTSSRASKARGLLARTSSSPYFTTGSAFGFGERRRGADPASKAHHLQSLA